MDMSTNQGELNIYLTPVTAERADDFEAWLRSTLFPAVAQVRPDLAPRAQTWRSDARQGLVYFAFLLEGDDPSGWQIDPILREALGDSATEAAWREWEALVVAPQIGGAFRRPPWAPAVLASPQAGRGGVRPDRGLPPWGRVSTQSGGCSQDALC